MDSFDEKSAFFTPLLCVLCLYNLQIHLNFQVLNTTVLHICIYKPINKVMFENSHL